MVTIINSPIPAQPIVLCRKLSFPPKELTVGTSVHALCLLPIVRCHVYLIVDGISFAPELHNNAEYGACTPSANTARSLASSPAAITAHRLRTKPHHSMSPYAVFDSQFRLPVTVSSPCSNAMR